MLDAMQLIVGYHSPYLRLDDGFRLCCSFTAKKRGGVKFLVYGGCNETLCTLSRLFFFLLETTNATFNCTLHSNRVNRTAKVLAQNSHKG